MNWEKDYVETGFESSATTAEFDRVAVEKAGVLSIISQARYARPVETESIPNAPEYGTRVIGTMGTGNSGVIVLVGRAPRTRALLRQGKIDLLRRNNVPEQVAQVAASMRYGMEIAVAKQAAEVIQAVFARGSFNGLSHLAFERWVGEDGEVLSLSFPRKLAAAAIANEVVLRWRLKADIESSNSPTAMQRAFVEAGGEL
jgi:hypothetical protein